MLAVMAILIVYLEKHVWGETSQRDKVDCMKGCLFAIHLRHCFEKDVERVYIAEKSGPTLRSRLVRSAL